MPILLIVLFCVSVCVSGCAFRGPQQVKRFWADYNTLKTPAIFFEEIDHLPYHAPRVEHFRWMYNEGPGRRGSQPRVVTTVSTVSEFGASEDQTMPSDKQVPLPQEPDFQPQQKANGVPPSPAPPIPEVNSPAAEERGSKPEPGGQPEQKTVIEGPTASAPNRTRFTTGPISIRTVTASKPTKAGRIGNNSAGRNRGKQPGGGWLFANP